MTSCCRWCSTRGSRPSATTAPGSRSTTWRTGSWPSWCGGIRTCSADVTVSGADEVNRNWDEIKREEKRARAAAAGIGRGRAGSVRA